MSKINIKLILFGSMIIFIGFHVLLSEYGVFTNPESGIVSFLAGFLPSITHDSVSTRNPLLETFDQILADLPGAYSFYQSPLLTPLPNIPDDFPHWFGVTNKVELGFTIDPIVLIFVVTGILISIGVISLLIYRKAV